MNALTGYFIRLGDALSQFINVLVFNGDSNHSVSGDAFRYKRELLRAVIDWLASPFEEDHCLNAYLNDVRKARELTEEAKRDHRV